MASVSYVYYFYHMLVGVREMLDRRFFCLMVFKIQMIDSAPESGPAHGCIEAITLPRTSLISGTR